MKDSLDKELKNFPHLGAIRENILLNKNSQVAKGDFTLYFTAYNTKRKKLFYLSASVAAAILLLLGLSLYKYQQNIKVKEQEYFVKQSEWIAITDEAILTTEYFRYLENQSLSTTEEDILWLSE
ncbi:hypothetical protein JCM31826_05190 [Thermaurantimonas aggregans]|uniref:Uncharacterized protein n=1 Tax=Thermaurantimonas aggregans TaxID=2173829 RepID=A0A401XJ23_9FLAO|nr:hypothetical protein [Thermaurantimonas aggregans]MCX8148948.1 hypothetical protein [Thermaurantimonas aggregans]GCD77037.1 hypothetical protein JCM31826_05190 [Thermaurantimonas aggregans]